MRAVVLLGLRGAGKSAVARVVASRLGRESVDLDRVIVDLAKKSIAQIFAEDGESSFRDDESEALAKALARVDSPVISPGGGVVLREINRDALRSSGAFIIYLKAKPETLARRVENDAATARDRPALVAGGALAEARALLEQREPLYLDIAHATIETDARSVDEVALAVLEKLR